MRECLLLTVSLSSLGVVAGRMQRKAQTVDSVFIKSHVYNALIAWFLSLVCLIIFGSEKIFDMLCYISSLCYLFCDRLIPKTATEKVTSLMPLSGWLGCSSFIRRMAWPCTSAPCLSKKAVGNPGWVLNTILSIFLLWNIWLIWQCFLQISHLQTLQQIPCGPNIILKIRSLLTIIQVYNGIWYFFPHRLGRWKRTRASFISEFASFLLRHHWRLLHSGYLSLIICWRNRLILHMSTCPHLTWTASSLSNQI